MVVTIFIITEIARWPKLRSFLIDVVFTNVDNPIGTCLCDQMKPSVETGLVQSHKNTVKNIAVYAVD